MPLAFTISDLRQQPEFFDSVADRIWQAWWGPNGYPLAYIKGRLAENMHDTPIPLALVPTFRSPRNVAAPPFRGLRKVVGTSKSMIPVPLSI